MSSPVRLVNVTSQSWHLFEELLGPGGIQGGCWCSYFRLHSAEFSAATPAGRHDVVHEAVDRGEPFGLVAVEDDRPVGWVSVSPRECFRRLERSPTARPEPGHDLTGTWSVVCFYLPRSSRGRGLARTLLDGAVEHAFGHGATIVEGYPVDLGGQRPVAAEIYQGTLGTFLAAGFELIGKRGSRRALVRKVAA